MRTYRRSTEIRASVPGGGEVRVFNEITTRETAVEIVPGTHTVTEMDFRRIRSEADPPGGGPRLTFDTDAEPSGEEGNPALAARLALFRNMIGAKLVVTSTPGGRIDRIDGTDDLRDRLRRGLPAGDAAEAMVAGIANPYALNHQLRNLLVVPETPLEKDQVWKFRDVQPLPSEATGVPAQLYFLGTARVASSGEGRLRVEFEGTVSLTPPPGMGPPQAALSEGIRRYRLEEGVFGGHGVVDTAAGALREAAHDTRLDLRLLKEDGSESASIPMVLAQRMEMVE